MYIESRKRSGRPDNLMVFNFRSIEKDFNPYIKSLESCSEKFKKFDCVDDWDRLIEKLKNRCDDKYAQGDIVASSVLFADEYAEFMQLVSLLLIDMSVPTKHQYKISMPCPICQREGFILFSHDDIEQENRYECRICGFERIESAGQDNDESIRQDDSLYAGVVYVKEIIDNNEIVGFYRFKKDTSLAEANLLVNDLKEQDEVVEVFAFWFDNDTLEVKIIK